MAEAQPAAGEARQIWCRGLAAGPVDLVLHGLAMLATALVLAIFLWLMGDIVRHGVGQLSWSYLTDPVEASGRSGGIAPVIVSTLWILGVCLLAVVPLGLATATMLYEASVGSEKLSRWVRRSLDVLAGAPSIVFGLFGNAFFSLYLGLGFSIVSGGLTLACMVLPIFVREAEEGLRAVPESYRLSAAALGLSRWRTWRSILLPAALPGIMVALVLGIARAMAETAALIFTSGYVTRWPSSWLDSGRSLSVHIYDLSMNVAGGEANAYGAALVLVALLVAINSLAVLLSERFVRRGWDV